MNSKITSSIAKALSGYPRVRITGAVALDDIKALEELVGATIPEDYASFLRDYGTIGFYGLEIYGLIDKNLNGEGPPNAYAMTKNDIADGSVPAKTIIIYSTGYGPVYLLDCSTSQVREWRYTNKYEDDAEKFDSFSNFLEKKIDETLQDYKKSLVS